MVATVAVEVCGGETKEGDLRYQHFSIYDSLASLSPCSKSLSDLKTIQIYFHVPSRADPNCCPYRHELCLLCAAHDEDDLHYSYG